VVQLPSHSLSPLPPLRAAALFLALVLGSCAAARPDRDPPVLGRINRYVDEVNLALDRALLGPLAELYAGLVPGFLRRRVSSFFANLGYLDVVLNDLLQGKLRQGGRDAARFLVNSTAGAGGLFDVATDLGFEEHDEDFGQTLGVWGLESGPYLVLPVLGPSSARDAWRWPVSVLTNPLSWSDDQDLQLSLRLLSAAEQRDRFAGRLAERDRSSIDPYAFTRSAYLQRREFLVHDGDPPARPEQGPEGELDLLDELEGLEQPQ
jgi:phospholipid-binding lipoprotein MlaA